MARYTIKLAKDEQNKLTETINKSMHSSQTYRAAYILLNCDKGSYAGETVTNEQICNILKIGMRTIDRVKKKFAEGGLENALNRQPTSRIYDRKVDGGY